jgi:hypothetical protein
MRTGQNSDSSTVPKLGIRRGASPRPCTIRAVDRRERLIENARLRSGLSSNDSRRLQISNRERMAIPLRIFSRLTSFEPQVPSLQNPRPPRDGRLIANADASSIGILSDQREPKDRSCSIPQSAPLIACSSTQAVLIYGSAIKTSRNTLKRRRIKISNRR